MHGGGVTDFCSGIELSSFRTEVSTFRYPKAKSKAKAPPSSSLPLTLAPKVRRDMLLLETADPSLDLSGDFGTIGRLSANAGGSGPAVTLDLKGKVSDGDVVPCNTMCVLAIDGAKARIETVFTDFVQLQVRMLPRPAAPACHISHPALPSACSRRARRSWTWRR